jgi:hypothetical protein
MSSRVPAEVDFPFRVNTFPLALVMPLGEEKFKLIGGMMTPNNDVDTQRTAILMDGLEGLAGAEADCGNVAGLLELHLATSPTQQMTATWGS